MKREKSENKGHERIKEVLSKDGDGFNRTTTSFAAIVGILQDV